MIARRDFLKGASVAAMAAVSGLPASDVHAQTVPWSAGTEPPKLKAPADACDCHIHIYDARFPIALGVITCNFEVWGWQLVGFRLQ